MGRGRTLLILGEPGTGKTFSLYKLAERCIQRREKDPTLPIPVILNLSSWSNKRQAIAEWLISELKVQYNLTDKSLSQRWIKEELLLLLFDGLDEVKTEYRNDCVKELNKFIRSHGSTEMVVCSRIQEYEVLSEHLELRSAICLQMLTSEYIDWYLRDIGKPIEGLRKMLKLDEELENFAKTPLILNIMTLTYKDYSLKDLLHQIDSGKNRYNQLWNNYIERMLQRRGKTRQYNDERIKFWLIWLANIMQENPQSDFRIKYMQPHSWLKNIIEQLLYSGILLIIILLTVLPLILSSKYFNNDVTGWATNILIAVAIIFIILQDSFTIQPLERLKIKNISKFIKVTYRDYLIGSIFSFTLPILIALSFYTYKQGNILYNPITERTEQVYLINFVNPKNYNLLHSSYILQPNSFPELSPSSLLNPSELFRLKNIKNSLPTLIKKLRAIINSLCALIKKFSNFMKSENISRVGESLFKYFQWFFLVIRNPEPLKFLFKFILSGNLQILFAFAFKAQILISLFKGLPFLADPISEEDDQYEYPSISQSLINIIPISFISGFTGGLTFGISYIILLLFVDNHALLAFLNPIYGTLFGSFFGLLIGSLASIKHFILRLVIYKNGYVPWNYTQFLNYTTERLLMRKNRSSYNFIHRMLLEHFAQMKEDQ